MKVMRAALVTLAGISVLGAAPLGGGFVAGQQAQARRTGPAEDRIRQMLRAGAAARGANPRVVVRADGSLAAAAGLHTRSYFGTATQVAQTFLAEYGVLSTPDWSPELRMGREISLGLDRFVEFQQTHEGLPVLGRSVRVMVDGERSVRAVYAKVAPRKGPERENWSVSEDEAILKAREAAKRSDAEVRRAERGWFDDGERLVPVWLIISEGPQMSGSWASTISAEDGRVIDHQSLLQHATRSARAGVYPQNPVTSKYSEAVLPRLTHSKLLFGENVQVYNYAKTLIGVGKVGTMEALALPDGAGSYFYDPFGADPRFSEVQTYYMVDKVVDHFKTLGWAGFPTPLTAVVHWADCSQPGVCSWEPNAYFSPTSFGGAGGIFFYHFAAGIDMSYDGDVVAHEVTHGVVTDLVGTVQSTTFKALNEGTADYFSSSIMNQAESGEFLAQLAHLRTPYLRTPQNANRYPVNLSGECHRDGNIWSGLLWDIRGLLGAEAADRVALYSLAAVGASGEFYDAGWAVADAAGYLYGDEAGSQVEQASGGRGLLSQAARMAGDAHEVRYGGLPTIDSIDPAGDLQAELCWRQYKFNVPAGFKSFRLELDATDDIAAFVKHRSPVEIHEDGTWNAEYFLDKGKSLVLEVGEGSDPEIQEGDYYLWVAGFRSDGRTRFGIRLSGEAAGDDRSMRRFTPLTLDGPDVLGSIVAGEWLNSRQFVLDIPASLTGAAVQVESDRDVDLYLRYMSPVAVGEQGTTVGDVEVTTDSSTETVILTKRTIPNLRAGLWAVGVVNHDPNGLAHFKLRAGGTTAPMPSPKTTVVTSGATNTASVPATYGAPMMADDQYAITVPLGAKKLTVQIVSAQRDVTISLRRGKQVVVENGAISADQSFRVMQTTQFSITDADVNPLQSGTWYLAFSNASTEAGDIKFKVVVE